MIKSLRAFLLSLACFGTSINTANANDSLISQKESQTEVFLKNGSTRNNRLKSNTKKTITPLDTTSISPAATAFLQEYFAIYGGGSIFNPDPAAIHVTLTPYKFNLLSYVVKFPKSSKLSPLKGLVDVDGNYLITRGKGITDPVKIQYLIDNSTAYPADARFGSTTAGNLNAYRLANGRFIYIDSSNLYAVIDVELGYANTFLDTWTFYYSASGRFDDNRAVTSPVSWDQIKKGLKSFPVGNQNASKQVYVIGEPNCPHCKFFYDSMLPYVNSGEVCLNWSQVAFIQTTSQNDVWAIMEGKTPSNTQGFKKTPKGALAYNEYFFDLGAIRGGIDVADAGIKNPNQQTVKKYNKIFNFYLSFVEFGTPTFFYQDITGQTLVKINEFANPEDYAAFVAGLKKEKKPGKNHNREKSNSD